jgi:hypothetical protein
MKALLQKIAAAYAANGKFHSFVVAMEYAAVGFLTTWTGGIPSGKAGWFALDSAFGGVLVGAFKGWLRNNVLARQALAGPNPLPLKTP